ncbi:MAG: sigma-70 family RNA polymerase sigma factor [Firmicutes bacterium]|nr:sigma-70 family RNA polymerase sigma factor [Bacillota bacterium]
MTDAERDEYIRYINDQYDLLIKKLAVEIVKKEEVVYDVKQQVLIKLTPKAEVLKPLHPRQVAAYVATTTKNVAITEYNRMTNYETQKEHMVENYAKTMTMDYVEFEAFEGKYGFSEEMWKLLMRLRPVEREIMIYAYYYELKTEEIGNILGTNREAIKKRLQRIRKKLKEMIEEEGVDFR